jgi:serine/threonine protein phosphatase 1
MGPDVITWAAPDSSRLLAPGLRIYAIGDIHGRFDLLEPLISAITIDLGNARPERTVEIFVGDYVDRGPQSREVIEWLTTTPPLTDERICLLGNHEEWLLRALDDVSAMPDWLFNGGGETLKSYGVKSEGLGGERMLVELQRAFREALPPAHHVFISALPRTVDFDPYLFVHAGIRPGVPIDAQDPEDLIWIRRPFLDSSADFGRIVVHGHTPTSRPDIRPNRINIDTGAVFQGRLTCLVLEGRTQRFFQTFLA